MAVERRRFVRARPTSDFDLRVEVSHDGITYVLQVVDVGVGGIGLLLEHPIDKRSVGEELPLTLTLPSELRFTATGRVQHRSEPTQVCGVELTSLDQGQSGALSRYVGDLLVRGQAS